MNYPFNVLLLLLLLLLFYFLLNDTLNKKLNLPAGGRKCLYESFIRMADSSNNEVNGSFYERSLNH